MNNRYSDLFFVYIEWIIIMIIILLIVMILIKGYVICIILNNEYVIWYLENCRFFFYEW